MKSKYSKLALLVMVVSLLTLTSACKSRAQREMEKAIKESADAYEKAVKESAEAYEKAVKESTDQYNKAVQESSKAINQTMEDYEDMVDDFND